MSDSSSDGTAPGARPRGRLTLSDPEPREDEASTGTGPRGPVRDTWREQVAGLRPSSGDESWAEVEIDTETPLDATTRHERPGRRRVRTEPAPASPRLQARYREPRAIGKGGMSTIHRVTDEVVGRSVAVKLFRTGGPMTPEDEERFVEEARITGQLEHPNIVPIHDLCVENGDQPPYFTMKLVEGRTLTELIRRHAQEPLSPRLLDELLEVFLRVCDAVAYAHTRGVVHRDLKPENIMVGSHGQVYVMDWGVARILPPSRSGRSAEARVRVPETAHRDERGSIIGTMIYMAPEQALGRTDEVDERTDVFGLGAMLFAILTARPLYLGRTHMEVLRMAREVAVTPPDVAAPHRAPPPELCRIVLRAISARPADRYPDVESLRAEVAAFVRGGGWFPSQTFPPGAVIVQEGAPGDDAFIIVSGTCDVVKAELGVPRLVKQLGPGEVFGEAGVFSARPRTASVVATSEVTVKRVTREALRLELEGRDWLRAFFEALADRFISTDAELSRLRAERG
jgi:serine/threonine-protein kinase